MTKERFIEGVIDDTGYFKLIEVMLFSMTGALLFGTISMALLPNKPRIQNENKGDK